MLRSLVLFAFALSASAHAVSKVYVYPIHAAKNLNAAETAFVTADGLSVYVDCGRLTFDDPTHDKVSSFSTNEECRQFVQDATEASGHATIELSGTALTLRVIR